MDFIALADFHKRRNDDFLRSILASYGSTDDGLFNQIKANAIIEVINWYWRFKCAAAITLFAAPCSHTNKTRPRIGHGEKMEKGANEDALIEFSAVWPYRR